MKLRTVVIASLATFLVIFRNDSGPTPKGFYYDHGAEPAKGRWLCFERLVLLRHQDLPNQPWLKPEVAKRPKATIPKGWAIMTDLGLMQAMRAQAT